MNIKKIGYATGVVGTSLVLLWIGILKFTPSEAKGIFPYIEHSVIMSWLYLIGDARHVSDFVGIFEITTAILLLVSFWSNRVGLFAGCLAVIIFVTTLSFLLSTPDIWKKMDGVTVTDFFVLKDIGFLAISLQIIGNNLEGLRTSYTKRKVYKV